MRTAILMPLALLCGCYTYVSAPAPGLSQGTPVRAHLSTPGSFNVGEVTANSVVAVRGEVVRWNPDELILSAFALETASGMEFDADGRTLTIPGSQIATVEAKRFDGLKTGAVAGLGLLLAIFGEAAFGDGGGGGGGSPNGGPVAK